MPGMQILRQKYKYHGQPKQDPSQHQSHSNGSQGEWLRLNSWQRIINMSKETTEDTNNSRLAPKKNKRLNGIRKWKEVWKCISKEVKILKKITLILKWKIEKATVTAQQGASPTEWVMRKAVLQEIGVRDRSAHVQIKHGRFWDTMKKVKLTNYKNTRRIVSCQRSRRNLQGKRKKGRMSTNVH